MWDGLEWYHGVPAVPVRFVLHCRSDLQCSCRPCRPCMTPDSHKSGVPRDLYINPPTSPSVLPPGSSSCCYSVPPPGPAPVVWWVPRSSASVNTNCLLFIALTYRIYSNKRRRLFNFSCLRYGVYFKSRNTKRKHFRCTISFTSWVFFHGLPTWS